VTLEGSNLDPPWLGREGEASLSKPQKSLFLHTLSLFSGARKKMRRQQLIVREGIRVCGRHSFAFIASRRHGRGGEIIGP
jgi:hypothetical protein